MLTGSDVGVTRAWGKTSIFMACINRFHLKSEIFDELDHILTCPEFRSVIFFKMQ